MTCPGPDPDPCCDQTQLERAVDNTWTPYYSIPTASSCPQYDADQYALEACTDQTACPSCPVALDLGADACPAVLESRDGEVVSQSTHEQRNAPGTWQAEGVAPPSREVV